MLGYLEYDSSIFNGTSFQFVYNTDLLNIYFVNPFNGFVMQTPGPDDEATIFDSTGILPTVVGGSGYTGGTNSNNGVWIAGTHYITLGNGELSDSIDDVVWSTTAVGAAVPEPAIILLLGLGLISVAGIRRKIEK